MKQWLEHTREQQGGHITIVQTIRNAIMAASVLASAALIAFMGSLAAAGINQSMTIGISAVILVISCFFSIRSIWMLASLSFQIQQPTRDNGKASDRLIQALGYLRISAGFLFLALVVACVRIFIRF